MLHLTETNPTRCGFAVDHAALLRGLAHPGDLRYDPAPMGLPDARAAVTDYAAKGARLDPERICLTASTVSGDEALHHCHEVSAGRLRLYPPAADDEELGVTLDTGSTALPRSRRVQLARLRSLAEPGMSPFRRVQAAARTRHRRGVRDRHREDHFMRCCVNQLSAGVEVCWNPSPT